MSAPSLFSSLSLPPWGVALALAAGAPFFVRLLSERWVAARRATTEELLARARTRAEPSESRPREGVDDAALVAEKGGS